MPPERAPAPIFDPEPAGPRRASGPGLIVAIVLLALTCGAALSINVVRTTYSPKGDEATYVALALSLAHDHDFSFDRTDLQRYWQIYGDGPEGIFLKRGAHDRIYFGKAFIYPLVVAPFVWLFGLNGMLLFHVLLLAAVCAAGYAFLAARSSRPAALVFSLGFVGASVVPLYAVWLTSEMFNFAAVFLAYFFWFYKEVAPAAVPAEGRWAAFLRGSSSDYAGALLLGRRFVAGLLVGLAFVAVTAGCFGVNAAITGQWNYQGGDRKTFYGTFPFQNADATFDNRGISMTTNDADTENVIDTPHFWSQLRHNVWYFLMGRHAGFVPYYFPGAAILLLWLAARRQQQAWHLFVLAAVGASVVILLIFLPYTWNGGGGPPGNRYFLSLYPALFFLTPALSSVGPGLAIWVGGLAFVAQLLVNPFVASKSVWLMAEHGLVRSLPVELTMISDLPINLDRTRSHLFYGQSPTILLYLLDENAWPPEVGGIWVAGRARAEIVFRTDHPIDRATLELSAPIANRVRVSIGAAATTVALKPGVPATVTLSAPGVYAHHSYGYLLTVSTADGFVPELVDPKSTDPRYLGVFVKLAVTESAAAR
jgi:hypothetical protein